MKLSDVQISDTTMELTKKLSAVLNGAGLGDCAFALSLLLVQTCKRGCPDDAEKACAYFVSECLKLLRGDCDEENVCDDA